MGTKAGTRFGLVAGLLAGTALALSPALAEPDTAAPAPKSETAAPAAAPAEATKPAAETPAPAPQAEAPKAPAATTDNATAAPAAATPPDAAAPAAPAQAAVTPPAAESAPSPVIAAAASKLSGKNAGAKADKADVAALAAYYATAKEPLWIKDGAFTPKATAAIAELKKAADWGLDPAAFDVPDLASGATVEAQGDAEARLSISALRYARFARGGRVDPLAVSNIWDMTPPLKEPSAVIAELAASATPDTYLTSLHPKHEGFVKLREALLKARGPQQEEQIDEALKVQLPEKGTLKPGDRSPEVVLLRKRMKMMAPVPDAEDLYEPILVEAVKGFQEDRGIRSNGQLNPRTRAALNAEGKPKKTNPGAGVDRIIANMERWRWLPEDLGGFYVINNIPEFVGRVYKGAEPVWEERIIVGQTSWPTPMLTSSMLYVIFKPEWGMPDGIKQKELLPRLKQAGGNGFFEQLFGGGGGGGRVIKAYGLRPTLNGRPVDPDSIDWSTADIRQYSFTQPAGGQNPLGEVKFRFPNRHDVYMHDTTQKNLFSQSFRALSHGCIRVQNPRKLAEVLLAEDKGWDAAKVGAQWSSGGEVTLTKPVPVYLAYFTARVDKEGKLRTFADMYGNDGRLLSALAGRAVRYEAPDHTGEDLVADVGPDDNYKPSGAPSTTGSTNDGDQAVSGKKKALPDSVVEDTGETPPPATNKKQKKSKEAAARRKKGDTTNDILTNAMSGLVAN